MGDRSWTAPRHSRAGVLAKRDLVLILYSIADPPEARRSAATLTVLSLASFMRGVRILGRTYENHRSWGLCFVTSLRLRTGSRRRRGLSYPDAVLLGTAQSLRWPA